KAAVRRSELYEKFVPMMVIAAHRKIGALYFYFPPLPTVEGY
ncbi:MAG: hypothetical protein ACI82S_002370, partial [Patiriisocius sp.]